MASLETELKIFKKELPPEALDIYIKNFGEDSCIKWFTSAKELVDFWDVVEDFSRFIDMEIPDFIKEIKDILKKAIVEKIKEEEYGVKNGIFTTLKIALSDYYKPLEYYEKLFWESFETTWASDDCQIHLEFWIKKFYKKLLKRCSKNTP